MGKNKKNKNKAVLTTNSGFVAQSNSVSNVVAPMTTQLPIKSEDIAQNEDIPQRQMDVKPNNGAVSDLNNTTNVMPTIQIQQHINLPALIQQNNQLQIENQFLHAQYQNLIAERSKILGEKDDIQMKLSNLKDLHIDEIKDLKQQNRLLIASNERLQIENQKLKEEIEELKVSNIELKSRLSNVEKQYDKLSSDFKKSQKSIDLAEQLMKRQLLDIFRGKCAEGLRIKDKRQLKFDSDEFKSFVKQKYNLIDADLDILQKIKKELNDQVHADPSEVEIASKIDSTTANKETWERIFFAMFQRYPIDVLNDYTEEEI